MNDINTSRESVLNSCIEDLRQALEEAEFLNVTGKYAEFQAWCNQIKVHLDFMHNFVSNYEELTRNNPEPSNNGKEHFRTNDFQWITHESNISHRAETHLLAFCQDYFLSHGEYPSEIRKDLARHMYFKEEKKKIQEIIDTVKDL